jgi:hypothetical protein
LLLADEQPMGVDANMRRDKPLGHDGGHARAPNALDVGTKLARLRRHGVHPALLTAKTHIARRTDDIGICGLI